jgi:hypothetical protein
MCTRIGSPVRAETSAAVKAHASPPGPVSSAKAEVVDEVERGDRDTVAFEPGVRDARAGPGGRRLLLQAMAPLTGDPGVNAPLDGSQWGGLLPNLFSSHPPFQMDGNFGFPAAIAEMLVQGHHDKVRLLPACPQAWADLRVGGIHVPGGLCIDLIVESGSLTHATVRRDAGQDDLPVRLTCGSREVKIRVPLGGEVQLDGDLVVIVEKGAAR